MNKLYIIIPAYNESENIKNVIQEWYPIVEKIGNGSKLVIINDGSTDNTFKIATSLKKQYEQLTVMNKPNSGHGATCIDGYKYAIAQKADYVFQTDSDGQTVAEEFWNLWQERETFDFLIGVRNKRQDGFGRIVVTKTLKLVLLLAFHSVVRDANTPFRLMRTEKLTKYIEVIPADFFLANVLLTTLVVKKQEKVGWFEITFRPRQAGINSINFPKIVRIGWRAVSEFHAFIKNKRTFFNS